MDQVEYEILDLYAEITEALYNQGISSNKLDRLIYLKRNHLINHPDSNNSVVLENRNVLHA